MKYFRSICLIYKKEDAYNACYLKEFFKWTGLSYVDYLYSAENSIFKEPEKCTFDIIVNINRVFPETEKAALGEIIGAKFIELEIAENAVLKDKLIDLLDEISGELLKKKDCGLLKILADMYEKYHLVSVLYEYTFVLLEKMNYEVHSKICDKFHIVLKEIEAGLNEYRSKSPDAKGDLFVEYALYAKYNCQKNINSLMLMQGKSIKFGVEQYLNSCNEIYDYDKQFFKVEFLKAKVSDQDCRYNALPRFYLEDCIEKCPVDICRSFHYYTLGKWREKNRQPFEAGKAYRLAYYNFPSNIKAIFKIAVEKAKNNNPELAIRFLSEIINIWNDADDKGIMPPREIEYAYKTRMMISELTERQLEDVYIARSQQYSQFIQSLKQPENVQEYYFMKKMYPNQEELRDICDAMLRRMDIRCFKQF